MYKVLAIGDVHCKTSDLDECRKLVDFIIECIYKYDVNICFFSGDLYHYHNVVHLPVLKFWEDTFNRLAETKKVHTIAIVGNHDFGLDNPEAHALLPLKKIPNTIIVDKPTTFLNAIYAPYMVNKQELIDYCKNTNENILFCHETFQGAKYDNGFYAPDGIDQDLLPQEYIVSGHIHTKDLVGRVQYIGSPRWMTLSDANVAKSIWLLDIVDDGANSWIEQATQLHTEGVCTPIYYYIDNELEPLKLGENVNNAKITIDIHGSPQYISDRKKYFEKLGIKVKTFPFRVINKTVKESDGIGTAFNNFVKNFSSKNGTSTENLTKLAAERLKW